MIHLTYSNRTEDLLGALARDLARQRKRSHPLDPIHLVLPDRNLEAWLKQGLARELGIAANLEVHYLRRFVAGLLQRAGLPPLLDGSAIYDGLLALFLDADFLGGEELGPVRAYLLAGGSSEAALARRRHQLARRLSVLFEEYGYARPGMIADWEEGARAEGMAAWQRALWMELRRRKEEFLPLPSLLERLEEVAAPEAPVYFFGISHVAHAFHRILAGLGEAGELHVYTLNPCKEYWEDLPTVREARRGYGVLEEEDPFGLSGGGETPPLSLWGRPGRENIRLLNELTDCDFREAFTEPRHRSLLQQVQDDILHRRPERREPEEGFDLEGDESIQILAAPGIRREAEAIAARIWELVSKDPSLRFNEIGVAVAGREPELYFSHLAAAFEESYEIPYSLSDTSLLARSEAGQAVGLLLDLLLGRFEREKMLRFLTHPCVRARFPEADPAAWESLVDRLGIYLGADREDLEGTYVEEDALNWDQGLRRLALGVVLPGEEAAFRTEKGEAYLPEEGEEGDWKFAALTRSLLSDLRFAQRAKLSTEGWARLFDLLAETYVLPRSDRERQQLDRCRGALRRIGELGIEGREIGCALAVEIAKEELGKLPGGVGRYLAEGVAIATLQPMRAIPFRVLFVVGLGEGLFPASDRRDPLDLRQERFQPGDVSPRERDQYMFLEALLCARERFILSYVARDEQTGDPLPPSPVVQALLEMLEKGYIGSRKALVSRIPLRHWQEDARHPAPRAAGERWAARLHAQAGARGRIEVEELASRFSDEERERLEERLGIVRLAEDRGKAEATRTLQLYHLRRFLECPLQGSATALAGLREDEEDLADRPREPFELENREARRMARKAIETWLRCGRPLPSLLEELYFQVLSRGRAPVGLFGKIAGEGHLAILESWSRALGDERPSVAVYRFGPGYDGEKADHRLGPLRLAEGLFLQGRTELLRVDEEGPRNSLLFWTWPKMKPEAELRTLLRAFFDHLLLSAAGLHAGGPHHAIRFARDGSEPVEDVFAPLTSDQARRYLEDLASDLLEGEHAYFLPCEAVLGWFRARKKGKDPRLVDLIDAERGPFASPSSRYGPLRDSQSYPAPDEEEAREIARRRFGLFWDLLQKGEALAGGQKP